jgi:hypothetical protein
MGGRHGLFYLFDQFHDSWQLFFVNPDEKIFSPQMNGHHVFPITLREFDPFDVDFMNPRASIFEGTFQHIPIEGENHGRGTGKQHSFFLYFHFAFLWQD